MDLASGMTAALLPFHGGSHVPEMLGSFHLDDHNVEEWSDATRPGTHHRGRKEIGKWINPDRNADIKYQKQEDNTRFHGGEEKQRQETIEGNSPDSEFQIIRTQHQIQGKNENSDSRTSTSTSFSTSSSNGVRSTTKTQTNKTTSKTVVISGGGGGGVRNEEFENLKLSCLPLDTSTQRERINMGRSGTMGVRRPPTRRHHQPPSTGTAAATVMEDDNEQLNSALSMRLTDNSTKETLNSLTEDTEQPPAAVSGHKKISPKICVGFPAEIQMELQTKLRGPGSLLLANGSSSGNYNSRNGSGRESSPNAILETESFVGSHEKRLRNSSSNIGHQFSIPFINNFSSAIHNNESTETNRDRLHVPGGGTSYDFSQRRKSYGFEPFETTDDGFKNANQNRNSYIEPIAHSNNFVNSGDYSLKPISQKLKPPPVLTSSWDLIQNISREQESNNNSNQLSHSNQRTRRFTSPLKDSQQIHSYSDYLNSMNYNGGSFGDGSNEDYSLKMKFNPFIEDDGHKEGKPPNTITSNNILNRLSDSALDALGFSNRRHGGDHNQVPGEPDIVLLAENNRRNRKSSGKLTKMSEEATPDLLNQMSFKSHLHLTPPQQSKSKSYASFYSKPFAVAADDELCFSNEDKKTPVWEDDLHVINDSEKGNYNYTQRSTTTSHLTQRSTSESNSVYADSEMDDEYPYPPYDEDENVGEDQFFTNDKREFLINRNPLILDLTSNKMFQTQAKNDASRLHHDDEDNEFLLTSSSNNNNNLKKPTQVSQTWISSVDAVENGLHQQQQQHARDHDVTTSIYAINDPFRKPLKKVEFCKTEVHFTPEPGRFQIVESDENKPSTIHLYRRKKRGERKTAEFLRSTLLAINDEFGQTGDVSYDAKEEPKQIMQPTGFTNNESLFSNRLRGTTNNEQQLIQDEIDKDDDLAKIAAASPKSNKLPPTTNTNNSNLSSSISNSHSTTFTPTSKDVMMGHNYCYHHHHLEKEAPEEEEDVLIVSSSRTRPFSPSKFKEITNGDQSPDNSGSGSSSNSSNLFAQLKNLNVNLNGSNNLSFYQNNDDTDDDDDEMSNISSPNHTITTQFGDLKIQKYLKQLKTLSSAQGDVDNSDDGDFNRTQREKLLRGKHFRERMLNELAERKSGHHTIIDDNNDGTNFRYDNVFYENGSFVPLATRRSLIEMNNRNRRQQQGNNLRPSSTLKSLGTTSDNSSSTMSNYSLPCSDNSHRDRPEYHPLKLTAMEATVATTGTTPQITSVELRYAVDNSATKETSEQQQQRNQKSQVYVPEGNFSPFVNRSGTSSNRFQQQQQLNNFDRRENHRSFERIPSPVMPPASSFRSIQPDGLLFHSEQRRARSTFSLSPTHSPAVSPTLANPKPPTPILPIHFSTSALNNFGHSVSPLPPKPPARRQNSQTKLPSKSVVRIGAADRCKIESNETKKEQVPSEYELLQQQSNSGSSILRSLTFPKSTRLEPEWVLKAKSRETRMTDWNLVGKQQQYDTPPRQAEPPWIAELRVKNKSNPIPEEAKSAAAQKSVVYPWNIPPAIPTPKNDKVENSLRTKSPSKAMEIKGKGHETGKNFAQKAKDSHSPDAKLPKAKPSISELKVSGKLTQANSRSTSALGRKLDENQETAVCKTKTPSPLVSKSKVSRISIGNGLDVKVSLPERSSSPTKTPGTGNAKAIQDSKSKPSQAQVKSNKTSNSNQNSSVQPKMVRQVKPAAPPKPPKPPQRSTAAAAAGASGTKTPESKPNPNPRLKKRSNVNISDIEASPGSTRSNTPIYLHPMVKVSKLPLKTPKTNSTPEGKRTPTNRTKPSATPTSDAKRVRKAPHDEVQSSSIKRTTGSPRNTPTPTSNKNSLLGVKISGSPSPRAARTDVVDPSSTKRR